MNQSNLLVQLEICVVDELLMELTEILGQVGVQRAAKLSHLGHEPQSRRYVVLSPLMLGAIRHTAHVATFSLESTVAIQTKLHLPRQIRLDTIHVDHFGQIHHLGHRFYAQQLEGLQQRQTIIFDAIPIEARIAKEFRWAHTTHIQQVATPKQRRRKRN